MLRTADLYNDDSRVKQWANSKKEGIQEYNFAFWKLGLWHN